nr:CheR family methyltransferase [Paenibacillus athensensis]
MGASAGGLEALEQFFNHMHPRSGMSFVIIQHLSPHYKSFMAELLASHTSMNIELAEDGMIIHPNHVYLLPPSKNMTIQQGRLALIDVVPKAGLNLPIDLFLHSLAQERGAHAIAVILSGTGSDGSKGIAAIKEAGGLVFVQDEETAKFDGMPTSARLTGHVDAVLAPGEMADKLLAISRNRTTSAQIELDFSSKNQTDLYIKQIFDLIKQTSGIDFNYYKRNSVFRRIERRMMLCNIGTLASYTEFLTQSKSELGALRKDLLIGVTQFFRDAEAFEIIEKKVLPALFEQKKHDREMRVWIAGCSTGEEAYSLAILIREYMDKVGEEYTVKMFATDLDKDSVEFAGHGIYPESAVKGVPPVLLERYFTKDEETYRISKELRKMIVFAQHNITKDPPFSNLDLITCRNMLIYLQPDMQRKVLSLFHFVLNSKGVLFLGPSESIGRLTHQFEPVDRRWNIFQHKRLKDSHLSGYMDVSSEVREVRSARQPVKVYPHIHDEQTFRRADDIYTVFVDEHMPPCMVIDENNEIIHLSGNVNPYLTPARGKPSWNLYKMVEPHLSVAIATAFQRVRRDKLPVVYKAIKLHNRGGEDAAINLTIKPFSDRSKELEKLALVIFEPVAVPPAIQEEVVRETTFDITSNVNQRVIELEMELQRAEETLQATVEELETSNEELQATNEELVAANEELQSTNEELQSVNEELVTVNTEYQYKIQELTELNNDMNNFLVSTKIGTIFLDKNMCIRRFTPAITKEINLLDVDYGRPISHISHNFKSENLVKEAKKVLRTLTPLEKEVQSTSGKWYSMRILPYRTADNFISGIVITFVDITELKRANAELVKLSYAIEQSPSIAVISDLEGRVEYVNPHYSKLTGYTLDEVMGRNLRFLNTWENGEVSYQEIWETVNNGHIWTGELESQKKNGEVYWESVRILPIKNKKGKTIQYLKVAEDITDRRNSEELLRKSEMLSAIGQLAAGIAHEIRNPLTALKGFTKLLTTGIHNESYIRVMSEELNRIEEIVSELLVLAKPQALEFAAKSVAAICRDVIMLLDTQAIMNNIEIAFEAPETGVEVHCVENQLKQVFINILKNAIEAMPGGGHIIVRIEPDSHRQLTVSIIDHGVGIPENKLPRLGEPFYSTKDKGTGLGLMVSCKIIENHQGSIAFASEQGKGTTVSITLPLYAGG